MLRLGLIIHTDVFRKKKPWRNEEEGADNRYGAICRGHGGPIGTRNGPPPEENSTALLQTGWLNLALDGGGVQGFRKHA